MAKLRRIIQNGQIAGAEIVQPGMHVRFPKLYGGIALEWFGENGIPVVHAHPGEGAQITWDTGQDPTPAGVSGSTDYSVVIPSTGADEYYAIEETFLVDKPGHEALYQIGGIAPFFWISHDYGSADDAIPPDPRGDHGWSLLYHDICNLGAAFYQQPGTPIVFESRPGVPSGIILIGDEIVKIYDPVAPWWKRVCRIEHGNVAFRVNISMKDAPSDAIAAIFFRRDIPLNDQSDINTVFNSPGGSLYINRFGGIEIHHNGSKVATVVANGLPDITAALNSDAGVELEIRSIEHSNVMDVYANNKFRGSYSIPTRGPHLGLFASCSSGRIKFSHRDVYDTGARYSCAYRSTARDTMLWEASVYRVSEPFTAPFYRTNLPVVFTDPNIREEIKIWNRDGTERVLDPFDKQHGMFVLLDDVLALYAGKADGSAGVFCRIHGWTGHPDAHAGVWPHAIALNTLPHSANNTPVPVSYTSMTSEWATKVRLDLLS